MPTTLSGKLLTNYRTTSKYSEVFKYPSSLDTSYELASYFLLDDFLILVEENSASRKLIIDNITNSTRVLTKDLTTFQNPLYLLDPVEKTLAILAKPNIVATLKLTNGVWGDLQSTTLVSNLPEYTAQPIFHSRKVFIPSGSNVYIVDVTRTDGAVVTKTFSTTDQITAIEVDLRANNFYMTGRNTAIIYSYDLNSVITASATLQQVGSFRVRADKRPIYLNTITNLFLGYQGYNLVSSFNDGSVYKFNTSNRSAKEIMSVLGDVHYLNGVKDQYSVISTSDLEVKLYDFSKEEEIQLEHNSHDPLKALKPFITSQFLLIGDKTGSISFYKLEEIPTLKINYVRLEAKEPTLRYLDINAEVQSNNPNIKIAAPIEVKLEYRGGVAVKTFQETGQKRNFYVPLTDYTNILKESSLFLGSGLISYTLTSLVSGVQVRDTYDLSSLDQQALTDENVVLQGKLSKFYLKDVYSAEDALYFKMMYLSQAANSLLLTFNNTEKILFTKEKEEIVRSYYQNIHNNGVLGNCNTIITFKDKNLITNKNEDWAQNYTVINTNGISDADHTFIRMDSTTRISTKDFIQLKPSTTYKLSIKRLTKNNIYYKITLSTVADYRVPNSRLDEDVWVKNSSFTTFTTPATCKYGIISLGSDTPLTTNVLGRDIEVTLEEYDDYKEVAPVDKYHLFKLPHVTSHLTSNKIPLKVDLIENGVVRETISTTKEVTPKYAYKDIKYSTSDGDLRYQDELLLTELEQGPKTEFLKDNTYTPTIIPISKQDIKLTDDSKLGNIISGEGEVGYLSFPIRSDYAKHLYKSDTLVMDIYINGYRLPRTNSQQQYNLEIGSLRVDYPVRDLQKILTNQQLNDLFNKNVSDVACGVSMIAVVRRKSLISTELVLCSYTVSDTYQNDIKALQGNGIYIPFKTSHNNLTQAQLRLFIRNKGDNLISRYNPSNYTLTLDLKNKQILVQLLGTTNLGIGSELIIVDSGYLTNTVKYVNTNTTYRMDSLPLVYFDSDNNIYNGLTAKAEDLDVMVNGLTLIPMKDYTVIEPTLINTPTMLIFKNYLPVGSTVEVNYLPENCQRVVTWSKPAVGTTNKFSLDDERNVFVKGTFETFVNNLKIDEDKVQVLNNRTIAINVDKPRNVMVRFSNKPHSNLKLIEDTCKFNTIDINDNNYHSGIGDSELSLFDTTSLGRSTDIGKVALYDLLEAERNNHQQNEPIILDCNESSTLLTDIYLDSKYIENQYLTRDLIINANEVSLPNQKPDINNPNI